MQTSQLKQRASNSTKTKNSKSFSKNIENSIANRRLLSVEKELGLEGLFDGPLYHLSFDCPKPLARAFKEATHRDGTSICKELQKYMLIYLTADHVEKTAYGNTLRKVLKPNIAIGLNFEQYCQTKPRRWINKSIEQVKGTDNSGKKFSFCEIGNCDNPAIAVMTYSKEKNDYRVCLLHQKEYCKNDFWIFKENLKSSEGGTGIV
jgi:hypothetical protein